MLIVVHIHHLNWELVPLGEETKSCNYSENLAVMNNDYIFLSVISRCQMTRSYLLPTYNLIDR